MPKAKFEMGQCSATEDALAALTKNKQTPIAYLARHSSGDWGELSADDAARNEAALTPDEEGQCDRILSAYRLPDNTKIWIITEWDRSRTTILLPSEY
jgi:hypothetical protein